MAKTVGTVAFERHKIYNDVRSVTNAAVRWEHLLKYPFFVVFVTACYENVPRLQDREERLDRVSGLHNEVLFELSLEQVRPQDWGRPTARWRIQVSTLQRRVQLCRLHARAAGYFRKFPQGFGDHYLGVVVPAPRQNTPFW